MKKFSDFQSPEVYGKIKSFDTVCEMWKNCLLLYKDNKAISLTDASYTFGELEKDAASFRTVLLSKGLKRNDRVLLIAPNSYEFVVGFLAAVTLGMTVSVLPAQLDETAVFGCTMKFGAKAVLYADELEAKTVIAAAKGILTVSLSSKAETETPLDDTVTADTPCVIMFTGGTTGKSKGALLDHGAVMQGTVNGCYGYEAVFEQRYLLLLPLSHVFGLIRNLLTSLCTGSTLFICHNNKDMFRDIAVFRPTILVFVPALAEMALNLSRQFGKNMLGEDLKYIICGAAPVAPYLIAEYNKMGIGVCPGYGLTESANLVSGNPDFINRPDSVGLFYDNQEYKIVNGELWLKGKNMMTCYVGDEEENRNAFSDGWFRTGDLARVDSDGFLYITGRIKEIILLSNGENVSPAEVEAHFDALEDVMASQVFEDIDESGRHILALEVVPRMTELNKKDAENKTEYLINELKAVNDSLPSHFRVNKITVRDKDFERTPSMKIVRYHKC